MQLFLIKAPQWSVKHMVNLNFQSTCKKTKPRYRIKGWCNCYSHPVRRERNRFGFCLGLSSSRQPTGPPGANLSVLLLFCMYQQRSGGKDQREARRYHQDTPHWNENGGERVHQKSHWSPGKIESYYCRRASQHILTLWNFSARIT